MFKENLCLVTSPFGNVFSTKKVIIFSASLKRKYHLKFFLWQINHDKNWSRNPNSIRRFVCPMSFLCLSKVQSKSEFWKARKHQTNSSFLQSNTTGVHRIIMTEFYWTSVLKLILLKSWKLDRRDFLVPDHLMILHVLNSVVLYVVHLLRLQRIAD